MLDQMPGMGFVPNLVSFLKNLTVYLHGNILLISSSLLEREIKKYTERTLTKFRRFCAEYM